ncbi:MAG TPA: hypothetical protein VIF60_23185 [Burkholderiaceae bacterium]|jgi:hypothetical protein
MASVERLELQAHREQIVADVRKLVEKYRTIFDWDVAEIDQNLRDNLILGEIRKALDDIRIEFTEDPGLQA